MPSDFTKGLMQGLEGIVNRKRAIDTTIESAPAKKKKKKKVDRQTLRDYVMSDSESMAEFLQDNGEDPSLYDLSEHD